MRDAAKDRDRVIVGRFDPHSWLARADLHGPTYEVVKAQTNKVRLARLKGELVDRPQAIAHVFKLARSERDA